MACRRPGGGRARRVGARATLSDRRSEARSRHAPRPALPGARPTIFRGTDPEPVARGRGRPGAPSPRGCAARDGRRPRACQRSLLRERRPRADRAPPRSRAAARERRSAAGRERCSSRHLPDDLFNQAVLKCAFVGLRLGRIERVEERVTPELARMLFAYVTEREHAGRSVGADLWPLIAVHPPPGALERLRDRLATAAAPDERRVSEVALPRAER